MQNYERYKSITGITNSDIINAVRREYPGFSKITLSLAGKPSKYAVCLIPEAEKILADQFGAADGLRFCPPAKRSEPKRTKPNRLSFRVDDAMLLRLSRLMTKRGFSSWQDFLSSLITEILNGENDRKE